MSRNAGPLSFVGTIRRETAVEERPFMAALVPGSIVGELQLGKALKGGTIPIRRRGSGDPLFHGVLNHY